MRPIAKMAGRTIGVSTSRIARMAVMDNTADHNPAIPSTGRASQPALEMLHSCTGRAGRAAMPGTALTEATGDHWMAKEELLEFDGTVTEVLPDGNFRVKLDNEHEVLAYTAGKMRKFRIRTGVGDRVIVEMSPYDLQRGRISFRHKGDAPSPAPQQRRPNFRGRR